MFTLTIVPKTGNQVTIAPRNENELAALCRQGRWAQFVREFALIVLYMGQTPQERAAGRSIERNGIGLNKHKAPFGSYYAEYIGLKLSEGGRLGKCLDLDKHIGGRAANVRQETDRIIADHLGQVLKIWESMDSFKGFSQALQNLLPEMSARSKKQNKLSLTQAEKLLIGMK